eukprot:6348325-Pyramimonas_sp.AAC.1
MVSHCSCLVPRCPRDGSDAASLVTPFGPARLLVAPHDGPTVLPTQHGRRATTRDCQTCNVALVAP